MKLLVDEYELYCVRGNSSCLARVNRKMGKERGLGMLYFRLCVLTGVR